jgi:hypothetical protein
MINTTHLTDILVLEALSLRQEGHDLFTNIALGVCVSFVLVYNHGSSTVYRSSPLLPGLSGTVIGHSVVPVRVGPSSRSLSIFCGSKEVETLTVP